MDNSRENVVESELAPVERSSLQAATTKLPYAVVDVFTGTRWTGNPLAVVLDAGRLTASDMQAIAREMNLSETTFVFRRPKSVEEKRGIRVRIFTTKEELPFAGHPTLGTAWLLRSANAGVTVTLDLNGGRIPVSFFENESGLFGEMLQPKPIFGKEHPSELIAKLVGVTPQELVDEIPIQTVSTGRAKIIVPFRTLSAIQRVKLDFPAIESYCQTTDKAAGLYLVTKETEDPSARIHARNILKWTEDPVTGSAGGACIAWMVQHGWARSKERIMIEQGSEIGRRGAMFGSALLHNETVTEIRLGGQCVLSGRGELEI